MQEARIRYIALVAIIDQGAVGKRDIKKISRMKDL